MDRILKRKGENDEKLNETKKVVIAVADIVTCLCCVFRFKYEKYASSRIVYGRIFRTREFFGIYRRRIVFKYKYI